MQKIKYIYKYITPNIEKNPNFGLSIIVFPRALVGEQ